ncbi:MAG: BamA/TamA family outer membrane protein [Vicinamibacteria bacterium]
MQAALRTFPRWRARLSALAALVALPSLVSAAEKERRTVVAGTYPASGFHRWLLGTDYRDTWATPVEVEVLDLASEGGGLKATARVGGQQTKGLALAGADGRSYTFRGLEKDASHLLDVVDERLKDTVIARLLNDQMVAQHPASELVARGILETVGIPVPDWRLVVLPDDPALGAFRQDFAGALGVFAVYPQPAKGAVPGFLDATEIIDHKELYKRIEAGTDAADTEALLRARLVDVLMGDWDRHRKQWRWARTPASARWLPIPEDRDQAFSRYEGLLLGMARGTDPRFQDFDARYPKIGGLTFNGSEQDRRLLVGFAREEFVRAAEALRAQLSDAALEQAARRMPPEWYARDGAALVAALRARRDALPAVAAEYHRHLAGRVDVYLTHGPDRVEARRLENGDMDVTARQGESAEPSFHRVFDGKETEEVRFYGLDGDDAVVVSGGGRGPRVRLVGGKGNDSLDASGAGNAKLSDSEGRNRAVAAQEDARAYTPPPPPRNAPWIPPRDWTRESVGVPWIAYGGDLGAFLGYGFRTQAFGFRKTPFASAHQVRAGWSIRQGSGRADYLGEFHRENRASSYGVYAYASGVEVLRFYGFGNEVTAAADADVNKVDANQFLLHPTWRLPFGGKGLLTLGPVLKYNQTERRADQLIDAFRPYGAGDFGELGVNGVLSWDGRDSRVFPRKGVFVAARGTYVPEAWDVTSHFGEVNGNLNAYLSAGQAVTLALRAGGKKVFGAYPYFEGASIGEGGLGENALDEPEDTVRGYRARRYLGDASLWGQSEVRLRVSGLTLVVPGTWGIHGFADAGRVWLEGESSDTWHVGVGGGIWISLLNDRMSLTTGLSHGKESDLFYVRGGFSY